ncbi:hypothetical protein RYX36_025045 [Vicia faba]
MGNADPTKNQKKKMQGKAKRVAQGCVEKECSDEAGEHYKEPEQENRINGVKSSVEESVENKSNSSFSEGGSTQTFEKDVTQGNHGHSKNSRSMEKKLRAAVDLKCKLVDFGNACWTYKQFTNDIQTRQYRCPEVLLGSKYSTPSAPSPLTLPLAAAADACLHRSSLFNSQVPPLSRLPQAIQRCGCL